MPMGMPHEEVHDTKCPVVGSSSRTQSQNNDSLLLGPNAKVNHISVHGAIPITSPRFTTRLLKICVRVRRIFVRVLMCTMWMVCERPVNNLSENGKWTYEQLEAINIGVDDGVPIE